LILLDAVPPKTVLNDRRVTHVVGDIDHVRVIEDALSTDTSSVFHLAAVLAREAEADFDIGMRVNFDGTRRLLERCRMLSVPPKFVFTSSLAVFGGRLQEPVSDDAPLTPQSSYGAQKAMCEHLLSDVTRKGFVDGRSLRLPTITVRPGHPTKAAGSFASSIISDSLSGVDVFCPVAPTTRLWVQSPSAVVDNIIIGHEAPSSAFTHMRSVNLPGLTIKVGDMVEALRRVGGGQAAAHVKWRHDATVERIVSTWPSSFTPSLGQTLGMRSDPDFESIIRSYQAE